VRCGAGMGSFKSLDNLEREFEKDIKSDFLCGRVCSVLAVVGLSHSRKRFAAVMAKLRSIRAFPFYSNLFHHPSLFLRRMRSTLRQAGSRMTNSRGGGCGLAE